MEHEVSNPRWSIKDVAWALIIVFGGSYLIGLVFRPLVSQALIAQRYLFSGVVQTLLFIGSVFAIIFFRYKGNPGQLGLRDIISFPEIKRGVAGGVVLFTLVLVSGIFVSAVAPVQAKPQPFAQLLTQAKTPFEVFVPFFIGGVLAPLGEEIYFRGFAYPVFKEKLGVKGGILVTAVFFSLLHFDAVRFLPIAIGGAGLAWLYESTGLLITPIIAHSVWNFSMLGLLFLAYKGPSFF